MTDHDIPQPGGEILLYQTEDGRTRIECQFENETIWLTQAQMAELFQTTPQNITLHLKAIYTEGEQPEEATCKPYLQVRREGGRTIQRQVRHYRLEVVLAVGFCVRSHRGTQFRQWATARLQEYLLKGFVLDDERQPSRGWPGLPFCVCGSAKLRAQPAAGLRLARRELHRVLEGLIVRREA